jgi:hypothetical protein
MYDAKTQFLVENSAKRYTLNSTMLKSFRYGIDGSLAFNIQKDSPGPEPQPNWLPGPDGPFYVVLRLYMPGEEVQNGTWTKPSLVPAASARHAAS